MSEHIKIAEHWLRIPRETPGFPIPSFVRHPRRRRATGPEKPARGRQEPTVAPHWNATPAQAPASTPPDVDQPPRVPWTCYRYAACYAPDGTATIYRFRCPSDLALWIEYGEPGTRKRLFADHVLVRAAKRADCWPDVDEDAL